MNSLTYSKTLPSPNSARFWTMMAEYMAELGRNWVVMGHWDKARNCMDAAGDYLACARTLKEPLE